MRPFGTVLILLGVGASTLAIGVSEWTDTGTLLHPSETGDDVAIGGNSEANADIFLGANGNAVFNEQGNDADFKIEGSGQDNLLFVDASTDRIGIGTASPTADLHLVSSSSTEKDINVDKVVSANSAIELNLRRARGSIGSESDLLAADLVAGLSFQAWNNSASSYSTGALIRAAVVTAPNELELQFHTRGSGGSSQRMVIKDEGNVGIGTASPTEKLEINGRIELNADTPSTNDGAVWNDSVQKSLQTHVAGIEQSLSGVTFTATDTKVVTDTLTEGTIIEAMGVGDTELPANFFVPGKTIRVTVRGTVDIGMNETVTIKVYLDSNVMLNVTNVGPPMAIRGEYFEVSGIITCRTTTVGMTNGKFWSQGHVIVDNALFGMPEASEVSANTEDTLTVDVKATWAQTGNTIRGTNAIIEVLN